MEKTINQNIKNIIILIAISLFILYSQIFYSIDDIYLNSDGFFHLQRFLDVCQKIKDGCASPFMNYQVMEGFGYPTSLFYPDLFYYPFAFLSIFGLNKILCFKIYITFIFILTALSMYHIFSKLCKENKVKADRMTIVLSLLYAFNFYQYRHFIAGRIGELTAMIFIPFVVFGIYSIIKNKEHWLYLAIGMTGLIYSHILSAVVMVITIIFIYLINITKIYNEPYKIIALIKAGILTLCLTAKQIFPMLEMMISDDFLYKESFFTFPSFNEMTTQLFPVSLNYIFIILLGIIFLTAHKIPTAINFIFIGLFIWLLNTNLFDWDIIENNFNTITTIFQMPRRIIVASTALVIFGLFIVHKNLKKIPNVLLKTILIIFTFGNCIIFAFGPQAKNEEFLYSNIEENFNSKIYFAAYDYLPLDFDLKGITDKEDTFIIDMANVFREKKNELNIDITQEKNEYYINNYEYKTTIELPIVYYKGYVAKANGKFIPVEKSENGLLQINSKIGTPHITVYYQGTKIQEISIYISIFAFFYLLVLIYFEATHKSKTIFDNSILFFIEPEEYEEYADK